MAQFGSGRSVIAQNQSAVTDSNGNLIVSPDNAFGGSPLGVAARTQALYGIPNANFDILPADPYTAITSGNPLPYWDTQINGLGTALMAYDTATQTWAVTLDPTAGTAASETITLKARSYLLNDSNLSLRQKAFLNITKNGTQATDEWNLVLSATYYDADNNQLSTYNIGTANSGSAWTTINGFTTSGTAAIDAAAQYVDLAATLTTSAAVAGTATVNLNSLLIQTSTAVGRSFLITETFTSSGTFTVPTGVEYVTVVAIGAGQGGQGGTYRVFRASPQINPGGAGGSTGYWAVLPDIYVGNVSTVSVGVGSGGAGGTATAISKAAGGTAEFRNDSPSAASNGGDTTFGTYFTVAGARTAPTGFFGLSSSAGATGGIASGTASSAGGNGGTHTIGSTFTGAPFTTFTTVGAAGVAGVGSGGVGANGNGGTATVTAGIAGGGGGGGAGSATSGTGVSASAGGVGGPGGGASGGGAAARYFTTTTTVTGTAGNGANAPANSGGGGGGGGGLTIITGGGTAVYNPSTITASSSAGGAGGSGLLKVIYVG